ncbi:exported hypothetical protein [uncultured Alphaproteobacteria bacterium]|uniref:Lipocalin-like domain-containing protein n=1 Tax=uncultured Alphaproteobacteria bacterium TaxID=91750 RepID=A0A212JKV3_9PROT|nr:exported hypothetical protein [uncultured Alphaproteobacteria bacterium]
MVKPAQVLIAAALLAAALPARADDVPPTPESLDRSLPCPSIYGTWEIAFVIGRVRLVPIRPGEWWGGLLMRATIGEDEATLTWMKSDAGGARISVFKSDYPPGKYGNAFYGTAPNGATIGVRIIDGELLDIDPDQRCMLSLGEAPHAPSDDGYQSYIMRKVK